MESNEVQPIPYQLPLMDYHGLVKTLNEQCHGEITELLDRLPFKEDEVCVVVFGSDGKLERHPQSRTQLLFIQGATQTISPETILTSFKEANGMQYKDCFEASYIDSLPSVRTLKEEGQPLSYSYRNPDLVYPDQVLNAQPVWGNKSLYIQARAQVLEEISSSPYSRRISDHLKDQLRNHKKAMASGVSRGVVEFTVDPPVQYYSESGKVFAQGFKHSFLRAVQRKLDLLTAELVKKKIVDIDQLAKDLPTNTVEKIDYFAGKVNLKDPLQVQEAYLWFLQRYHEIQELCKDQDKAVSLPFDPVSFEKHKKVIDNFLTEQFSARIVDNALV